MASGSGYLAEDTIAAVSTGLGGAVAIVRLSGPRAFEVLGELVASPNAREGEPRRLYRAYILDRDGKRLDDVMFARFAAPGSFTGEDVVEIHIHGSSFIAHTLMSQLAELGIRQALPGEFSFRAVRNGKMSITQAEALPDLISATNDRALELALEKLSGTQAKLISGIAEGLRHLAMMSEVGIDFSDQDIDELSLSSLKRKLALERERLERLHSSYDRGIRLQDGVRVAFVGLPNAGKSSFFNALLGEERSIVTEIAGTTRDVVGERLTLRGKAGSVTFRLEDTAGLRESTDQVERLGIERSLKAARDADLVMLVLDASGDLDSALDRWRDLGAQVRTICVVAKCDLVSTQQRASVAARLASEGISEPVFTSAVSGEGVHDAAERMAAFAESQTSRMPGEVVLTRLDHVEAVGQAIEDLDRAAAAPEIELFAADIRQALHALQPLIGETLTDDILGQIFSEFCIGK